MSKRVIFVAHRFGYPGGTEQTMKRYANTAVEMGYDVAVFAADIRREQDSFYCGDLNNFTVTNDPVILLAPWDIIVVHGDGSAQNVVHRTNYPLGGPVFYLLCRPNEGLDVMKVGMQKATWIGCATSYDFAFAEKHGHKDKIRDIKGYPVECPLVVNPDLNMFGITEDKVYVSCGGFWPHKQFGNIVESFARVKPPNTELILTGYDQRFEQIDYVEMGRQAGVKVQAFLSDTPDAIYDLLNVADLYIWNSKPGSEGYGLVILESMYYNLPWIGTDTAGAHDLNGMGGVAYRTQEEFDHLLLNPPQRAEPTEAARLHDFVKDNFNTKALLNRIFSVLGE